VQPANYFHAQIAAPARNLQEKPMNTDVLVNERQKQSLAELVAQTAVKDAEFSTLRRDADEFVFTSRGVECGELLPIDDAARARIFAQVGAPVRYLEARSPELRAQILTEHARSGDFGRRPQIVMRSGSVFTMTGSALLNLPKHQILNTVKDELGTEGESLCVAQIEDTPDRLDVELVTAERSIAVRLGDVVQAGLHIVHSPFGKSATVVEAFVYRLVCSNGLTRRHCVNEGLTRTRKLPAANAYSYDLQVDQIRRLTRQTWNGLQPRLEALRATSDRCVEVEHFLRAWLPRARMFSKAMLDRLLSAWREEGGENSVYGGINALTHVATHDRELSLRQRRILASLAGLLSFADIHLCPKCLSVLAGSDEAAA
jgi:hypothetical protein